MNAIIRQSGLAAGLLLALAASAAQAAQAAGFTYHGSLQDGARPAEGRYDLRVTLYGDEHAVAPAAAPVTLYGVEVHEGRFSTTLDFAQDPPAYGWIGVAVRQAGSGDFVELAGRSAISGAGTCWSTSGNAGLTASNFVGTVDNTPVVFATNNLPAGRFTPFNDGPAFQANYGFAGADRAIAVNYGTAQGKDSFAGGYSGRVPTGNDRSFVWGGTARVPYVDSTLPDQFVVWADGGFIVNSSALTDSADDMVIYPRGGPGADSDVDLVLVSASLKYGRLYVNDDSGKLILNATSGVHIVNPVDIDGSLKIAGAASKATAGAWQANSDGRIKQDIVPVEDAIDTLAKVRPVTFRYTDAYRAEHPGVADERYYNVIAQEFAQVFPDAVTPSGEYLPGAAHTPDNEILQVDTYPAQIVTIAAVQELARRNADLEATVARLAARLARLEAAKGK
jgi:hypothetical protein